MDQSATVVGKLEKDRLPSQLEVDPRVQNGLELKDQYDQLRIFKSEELKKILEADNNN